MTEADFNGELTMWEKQTAAIDSAMLDVSPLYLMDCAIKEYKNRMGKEPTTIVCSEFFKDRLLDKIKFTEDVVKGLEENSVMGYKLKVMTNTPIKMYIYVM